MLFGETMQSIMPWDVPWWSPDVAIFVGILYLVLAGLGLGLFWVAYRTYRDISQDTEGTHHSDNQTDCMCKEKT